MSKLLNVGRWLLGVAFFQSAAYGLEVVVPYNSADCTGNLQAAFDGPADVIRIPNVGASWVTGPLFIRRSNVTVILDSGVVLLAKLGAYSANGACLIQARSCQNVTIRGFGASLRMQVGVGAEYQQFKNHHCLELLGVSNFIAEGLYITKAGTDGIFISGGFLPTESTFSSNVTIRDCDLDDNSRQGISVISAQDLLVERCVMRNTGVTSQDLPMAGIDFEPDLPTQRLVRCTVRDCQIFDNNGPTYANGILTATLNLRASSEPVSLNFERCRVTASRNSGNCVNLSGPPDNVGPLTTMTMTDCTIENTRGIGLFINSGKAKTTIQLTRTTIRNAFTDAAAWGGAPILIDGQDRDLTAYGNITFTDCSLFDSKPRPFLRSFEDRAGLPNSFCDGLRGNITVENPNPIGKTISLGFANNDQNVTLAINAPGGPGPVTPPSSIGRIQAENFTAQNGIVVEPTGDVGGGSNVGYVDPGDYMDYSVTVPSAGNYTVDFRIASPFTGKQIQLREGGTIYSSTIVPNTGNWQVYQTLTVANIPLAAGTRTLRIFTDTGGWNLNWFEIKAATGTPLPAEASQQIEAENYIAQVGTQLFQTGDVGGGSAVGYFDAGDTLDYAINIPTTGAYSFDFRLASAISGSQFQLKENTAVLAIINPPTTGAWDTWQTVNVPNITLTAGTHYLRINTVSGGFNFNWFKVTGGGAATPPPATSFAQKFEAEVFAAQNGVLVEPTGDTGGGSNIGYVDAGDTIDYSVTVPTTGNYTVEFRVASPFEGKRIQLKKGTAVLSTLTLANTGNWQIYQTLSAANIPLTAGTNSLRITTDTGGWNFNWFKISK